MESQKSIEHIKAMYHTYLEKMKKLEKERDAVFEAFRRALEKEKIAQVRNKLQSFDHNGTQ